jgi:hypothetical protein
VKLTGKQRDAFFAGEWPVLAGEGKPPLSRGDTHALSSRLSFEVLRVHLKRGRWRLEYRVIDDRDVRYWLLPAAASFLTDDDSGELSDLLPAEEEIGYTRSSRRRRADHLPTVAPRLQNVYSLRGRLNNAEHKRTTDPMAEARRDVARVAGEMRELAKRAVKMGADPMQSLGPIAREVRAQHEQLSRADAA